MLRKLPDIVTAALCFWLSKSAARVSLIAFQLSFCVVRSISKCFIHILVYLLKTALRAFSGCRGRHSEEHSCFDTHFTEDHCCGATYGAASVEVKSSPYAGLVLIDGMTSESPWSGPYHN